MATYATLSVIIILAIILNTTGNLLPVTEFICAVYILVIEYLKYDNLHSYLKFWNVLDNFTCILLVVAGVLYYTENTDESSVFKFM